MAVKIVLFALALSIYRVQSQSIGCSSNPCGSSFSSKGQSSCGCGQSQLKTIPYQQSNNNGLKASPQLQIVPNQNCNLQAIPLSQLLSQSQGYNSCNLQKVQPVNLPKQNIQVTSIPQIPSSTAQCSQPQSCGCNPSVLTAPVSTITIPPTSCTTIIDNSLSNSLANALQMMIANDFINSALSNNIVNQDCVSVPVVETCVPGFDLNSFVKYLNANQIQECQSCGTSYCQPDCDTCDWEKLLEKLDYSQCQQSKGSDWGAVLNYLNSKKSVECEPECDYNYFISSIKQKGQTIPQIAQKCPQELQVCNVQQGYPSQCDNSGLIEALTAYLGGSGSSCSSCNSCNSCGNVAEVVFPDEIPAQLVCNYGYMPTTVPVVSFSVQPIGDSNCNYIVGSQSC